MDHQRCCRRQKTPAFGLRMFTGRESDSVVGDKAGLSIDCDIFYNKGSLHKLKQTCYCEEESKIEREQRQHACSCYCYPKRLSNSFLVSCKDNILNQICCSSLR